ncbi:DoxX family protein [Edwardsiella tarda]
MMRVLRAILAVIFLLSGVAKLMALPFEVAAFERWGYAIGFMYVVGLAECAGAVGLLLPSVRRLAAGGLILLMLGALQTHLRHAEGGMAVLAALLLLALALVVWRPGGGDANRMGDSRRLR